MNRTEFIQEYLDRGFSLIPLKNNSKIPAIRWKKYQYKKASLEEIKKWFITFDDPNIALITGKELIIIDLDDILKFPELKKLLPDIEKTARVKTKKHFQFYFSNNGHKIRSTNNLFGLGIELKGYGSYVVAPPSKIDNSTYHFIIPLSQIKPLPDKIINESLLPETGIKESGQVPGDIEYKRGRVKNLPRYNGLKVSCIKQISDRNLRAGDKGTGERNESLFILFNLLIQNKNKREYARRYIILKNETISKPLSDEEIKNISEKSYNYKCSTIREKLPYIRCDECEFRFKGGRLGVKNILVKSIRKLLKLSSTESKIALLLGTYYEGEYPSINKIAEETKMNFDTVKNAIKVLKERGIINKSFYN